MKQVKMFKGWVGKSAKLPLYWANNKIYLALGHIFRTKGKRDEWHITDWPPKKIKITVELGG